MRKKAFNPEAAQYQAMNLFWEKGYESCSMEALLTEIGLSRSSFYNAFGNKRKLYEAVLEQFAQLSSLACQCLQSGKPMIEALNDFFQLTFFSPLSKLENGCLLVNTVLEQQGNDTALSRLASEKLLEIEQQFTRFFEHSKNTGQLKNKLSSSQLASYFMTLIKGLRVAAREGKPKEELQRIIQTTIQILEH